jgi:hypothetical protein
LPGARLIVQGIARSVDIRGEPTFQAAPYPSTQRNDNMAAKMANRNIKTDQRSTRVEDPHRYTPVDGRGARIYGGAGVVLAEAIRHASSLLAAVGIARVEDDGSLSAGSVSIDGGHPVFAPVAA